MPLGAQASGGTPGLARGFAVVSTDTGHQGMGGFDASFMQDQQASLDFAYAAIGRVAEVAKRIIAQHYGRPPDRSYFAGCSTGGREGMMMTQRYPTYFDGVVSGAPAMRTYFSGIGDRWVAVTLNEVAPKNAQGQPLTREALSESDEKTVIDGFLNACDAGDGVKDGMVLPLVHRHRRLGRAGRRAVEPGRHRPGLPRPKPDAVRVSAASALPGSRQPRGCRELPMPTMT
jgi:feruloyl esterase